MLAAWPSIRILIFAYVKFMFHIIALHFTQSQNGVRPVHQKVRRFFHTSRDGARLFDCFLTQRNSKCAPHIHADYYASWRRTNRKMLYAFALPVHELSTISSALSILIYCHTIIYAKCFLMWLPLTWKPTISSFKKRYRDIYLFAWWWYLWCLLCQHSYTQDYINEELRWILSKYHVNAKFLMQMIYCLFRFICYFF